MDTLKLRIGIIGGGQLGKMMIQEAKKLGFFVIILDPTPNCPASSLCDEHIAADFDDYEKIKLLASKCDVLTYEFEHIAAEPLLEIEASGKKVYPTPKSLLNIQNKFTQKSILQENNIPVADFIKVETVKDIENAAMGYPVILKTCTGGYDGKGNAFIKDPSGIESAFSSLGAGKTPLMLERCVPFKMETSILACRGIDGEIKVYPVGNNIHRDNILIETIVPAGLNKSAADNAISIARRVMDIFEGVGMFCIELFITEDDTVYVNEVAPRPHNSGHYSIEGCVTSQFEQHIRAITGLPLGDTTLIRPTVMINLLGEDGYCGKAFVSGLADALKIDGINVHIYGKELTSPKRKMGHFTVTANDLETAIKNAHTAHEKIKIIGADTTNNN